MWEPFKITYSELKGRVRAVSLPRSRGRIAVWTDAGYHRINYKSTARVTRVAEQSPTRFDAAAGTLRLDQDYAMYGQWEVGGELRVRLPEETPHPAGERAEADPERDELVVYDPTGAVRQRIPDFHHRSEPWALAAFSHDGRVLMAADPRGVRLFEFFADRGRENARWQTSGSRAERDALLASVVANPDDDTPRLVYADWLQEHGDAERAEFIRLQCGPDRGRYNAREWELYHRLGKRWAGELPAIRGVQWAGVFVRGFPQVTVKNAATLARSAEAVWAASPVEHVTLAGFAPEAVAKLADCPHLARVRHLTLHYYDPRAYDGFAGLEALLKSPHLCGLRRLEWNGYSHDGKDEGARRIAACPRLPGLEELSISGVREEAALAVARSPHLKKLRLLQLSYWGNFSREAKAELKKRFPDQKW
jgi:uncharacterized protein (TIGR02996 family)